MDLNKTQFRIIELITQKTEVSIRDISQNLKISVSLTYKYLNELIKGGFLEKKITKFVISSNMFARHLSNLIRDDSTLTEVLKNKGILILMSLIHKEDFRIEDLAKKIGSNPSSVYPYIRKFIKRQIIRRSKGNLSFNKELWGGLYEFISLYKSHYVLSQFKKLPSNAKIYYESPYEIIFSLQTEIDFAAKTAFSAYDTYGIKLMERELFYRLDHLPKKKLDTQTILLDSLRIAGAENEESARRRLYCYLFYKKNLNHLKKTKHHDLDILKKIVKGEINKEDGFPTKTEIIEKGEEYDLQI
ncbi:MAG: winged helix-turn-helix transcriptional regulator [Nanoarchaeota archaeon]|nr:winged helix-turn-helix transcriptional regulator [Nanoarchaeota archaeon]MBU1322315.1 winged helix-turn-helix transcriptional regulator [Nanoarchaeota archaeon]MBU1597854.1 winged helix-turn-helix transcriptional regulator [Nanoarchaeota archaeon]MBU2441441.1 winged helix-turn-helix transcriptional regulator [Nanoarchaeota archaeon]